MARGYLAGLLVLFLAGCSGSNATGADESATSLVTPEGTLPISVPDSTIPSTSIASSTSTGPPDVDTPTSGVPQTVRPAEPFAIADDQPDITTDENSAWVSRRSMTAESIELVVSTTWNLKQVSFLDEDPPLGVVTYAVVALDFHWNASDPTAVTIDIS